MTYPREYTVSRCPSGAPPGASPDAYPLDREWNETPWSSTPCLGLDHFMGERPEHRPVTEARILYDEAGLSVSFRVEDRYVLATAEKHQDSVCIDSCVEFFFTPGPNVAEGYFNIECNCGGTVLFHHQLSRGLHSRPMSLESIGAMGVRHSLPSRVQPEMPGPVTWTVRYRVPYEELERLAPVVRPAPGVIWRANVYKCADRSSRPHWLTWSLVDRPKPDFHRPDYFGILRFGR